MRLVNIVLLYLVALVQLQAYKSFRIIYASLRTLPLPPPTHHTFKLFA